MVLGIDTLIRLARGSLTAEQAVELARGLGWKVDFQDLIEVERPTAFQRAASAAVQIDSKVIAISGTDAHGNLVEALLVMVPAKKLKKSA
jgi:methylmalonyl-CoA mutase cobalamin-binding subunit